MDELDRALADAPVAPATPTGATGRKCRRHEWVAVSDFNGTRFFCNRCQTPRDEARAKRGRSSRRLGHDGERRSEKRYGWTKTGEFGGIDDLVGRTTVVQQKTTRAAPPVKWKSIFARLDERAAGRTPLILLSFVKQGTPAEDYILIRGADWLALYGKDGE